MYEGVAYTGVISAADISAGNGVVLIKSKDGDGGVVPAGVKSYDAFFFFETDELLDLDRFVVQSGQIGTFGDGANLDFIGGSDVCTAPAGGGAGQPLLDNDNLPAGLSGALGSFIGGICPPPAP